MSSLGRCPTWPCLLLPCRFVVLKAQVDNALRGLSVSVLAAVGGTLTLHRGRQIERVNDTLPYNSRSEREDYLIWIWCTDVF